MLQTYHIQINGIVQGVGFRPFVYKLAREAGFKGTVSNGADGVHIYINTDEQTAHLFAQNLVEHAPDRSKITGVLTEVKEKQSFKNFKIKESSDSEEKQVLPAPDYAICESCSHDIRQAENRRLNYAFTTCTVCGPRYSILERLPYDRENTSMKTFKMCAKCAHEYNDVEDRRYYSQTNSCPACGIQLYLQKHAEDTIQPADQKDAIQAITEAWNSGLIVAIKGIGGYLLTCDATNTLAIQTLRKRKNRPAKPFAVMYHDLYLMAEDVDVDVAAMLELQSAAAPIVLVKKKKDPWSAIAFDEIAPGLANIGVMLPYTPLYVLLMQAFNKPVIATSGNLSGNPIAFRAEQAVHDLSTIADLFVHNNREILIPQDDSVVNISPIKRSRILMRRSRGYAPNYITKKGDQYEDCILSMGGLLKSTFGLSANGNLFISQYLGDTDTYRTQENYELVLKHFFHLFDVRPKAIVCDKHPNYFSSLEAQRLADVWGLPLHKIQHHIAHFYAIMGEYDLQKQNVAVMGVIWDGTGLGDDGHIWGGEFFNFHSKQVERIAHIPYFQHIAGDKMAREPRISALAILYSYGFSTESLQVRFSEEEWDIYATMLSSGSKIMCSSMGRLFDAIASIVLDIDFQSYEGEAAMQLEQAAHSYFIEHLPHRNMSYFRELDPDECTIQALVKGIFSDHVKGIDPTFISARFHVSLIDHLDLVASQHHATCLAFSGGVFQNAWLVDIIHLFLSKKYSLYFHKEFSPNDENIAFGQLIYYFENQGL